MSAAGGFRDPYGEGMVPEHRAAPGKRWGRRILVAGLVVFLVVVLFAACGGGRGECREDYREDYYAKHSTWPTQSQVNSACGRSGRGGLGWIFLGGGSRSSGSDYRGGSFGSGK